MQYFCLKRNEIVSEEQYQHCLECTDPNSSYYTISHHGCATQKLIGYQNDEYFRDNMKKLIRKYKLERI